MLAKKMILGAANYPQVDKMNFPSYKHLLDLYFNQANGKQIIAHQIESFNHFMDVEIPLIIKQANPLLVRGSPEIPLSGPRSALASATGLSTSAANALLGKEIIAALGGTGGAKHEYEVSVEFTNPQIRKPTIFENNGSIQPMMPNDARLRNFTYASPLCVDINVTTTFIDNTRGGIRETKERLFPNVHLGKIPVMVGSKYCLLHEQGHLDPRKIGECAEDLGGYFIIQGGERVIISQERMSENRPFVFRNNRNPIKELEVVEIKCIGPKNEQVPKSNAVKIMYHPKNPQIHLLRVAIPRIKTEVPLFVVFRALGILADKDILDLILGPDGDSSFDDIIQESIEEAGFVVTQEQALAYLAEQAAASTSKTQRHIHVADLLAEELFPHIGKTEAAYEKACFLAHMTRKVLWIYSRRIQVDDRDGYPNKRVDLPGFLLANLVRGYFGTKMVKDMRAAIAKEIHSGSWRANGNYEDIINMSNIYKIIKSTILEVGLKSSLATGNFGNAKLGGPTKIGVSQVLNRLNYISAVSHLRRVSTPIEKTGKLVPPRKLNNTQWGFICPCETPEGHSVGVVKNMSSVANVSIYSNPAIVKEFLEASELYTGLKEATIEKKTHGTRIFLNGVWLGVADKEETEKLVAALRKAKRCGQIHIHTGIVWKIALKELWLTTEAGRIIRPILYAPAVREIIGDKTGHLRDEIDALADWEGVLLWQSPKGRNLIEYLDSGESDGAYIAMTPDKAVEDVRTTHCEIHPSTILGTIASNIPFPDHNQSPRNAYQSAMGKQAMGVYALNYRERFDAMSHVLCYPNTPLVNPFMSKFYGLQTMPSGENIVVAIMTYSGYNQEDSIMINRASLERGRFRSVFYRTYKDEEKKNQSSGEEERFDRPDPSLTRQMKHANYEKLGDDGLIPENTYVDSDDILIGKVVPLRVPTGMVLPAGTKRFRDVSRMPRNNEWGYIDKIFKNRNGEGYSFVKIRMRQDRMPEIGDKFCLTDDHDCLTKRGWVPIAEVTKDDMVAQLNKETGEMEYVHPIETLVFDHKGKMYEVETQGVSLHTTLNHRMWIQRRDSEKYELIEAEKIIGKRVRFQTDGPIAGKDISIEIGDHHFEGDTANAWLRFMGIWFAEGWTCINKKNYLHRIEIAANKERVVKACDEDLRTLGWNYNYRDEVKKLYVNEKDITTYLSEYSVGAINKTLPEWVWNLSANQCKKLIEGLMLGDGHETKSSCHYFTSSIKLANDIQRLTQHAGWTAYIVKRYEAGQTAHLKDGRTITSTVPSWCVQIRKTRLRPTLNHGHVNSQSGQTEIVREDFDGKVYCLRVPSEVFLVRRNGRCVWTGNSSRHGQKGTCGMILDPEDMPQTATGIIPDIIINPHCFTGETLVSAPNGTSRRIDSFSEQGLETVLTWNPETERLETSYSLGMEHKGKQETLRLTYEDGRDVICTKDHKFKVKDSTSGYIWKEAKDLTMDDELLLGPRGTEDIVCEKEDGWEMKSGETVYKMNNEARRQELFDYVRKLGGCIRDTNKINTSIITTDACPRSVRREFLAAYMTALMSDGEIYEIYKINNTIEELGLSKYYNITNYSDFYKQIGFRNNSILINKLDVLSSLEGYCSYNNSITYEEYVKKINLRDDGCYNMKLMKKEEAGVKDVYDIGVAGHHMFLANGTVVSNCIPSRMTIAQLMETLLGRICCETGTLGDGSPFNGVTLEWMAETLRDKYGLEPYSNEILYNGFTGRQMETKIFMGPCFYQRLRHCSADKMHSRASGPLVMLTRQPAEGRAREGGLRFGEMERDAVIAHGVAEFTKERLMECSDGFRCWVCRECGLIAVANQKEGIWQCRSCENRTGFAQVQIPYAYKLLLQELETMNITSRVRTAGGKHLQLKS